MITNSPYRPTTFFLTTFAATYSLWFAGAYVSFQDDDSGLYMMLMLPGLMAPFLISLVMILRAQKAELWSDFLNRLINPRLIEVKTLPAILLLMPLAVVFSLFLSLLWGGSLSQFQLAEGFSFSSGFVPVLLLLLLAAGFEELGWRGYAFDSLQSRYSSLVASLVFSLLWSLWHFPLLFVKSSYQYEIFHQNPWYAVNFFVSIIPMGIILSWICLKNQKSILVAILFHFVINLSQEILNITQTTKCIETVVLFAVAGVIVILDKDLFFSQSHLQQRKPLAQKYSRALLSVSVLYPSALGYDCDLEQRSGGK